MSLVGFRAQNHEQQVLPVHGARSHVDDRGTTRKLDPLHARFGFTVDVAAAPHNAKLPRFWTIEDDGLEQDWTGERVWCNPPYSAIAPWCEKAWRSNAELVVMLLPANRTEQRWWQDHINPGRLDGRIRVEFLPGRLRFLKPHQKHIGPNERPPFGCCLVIWDRTPPTERPRRDVAVHGAQRARHRPVRGTRRMGPRRPELDLDPLGIEFDGRACATRSAAGLRRFNSPRWSRRRAGARPGGVRAHHRPHRLPAVPGVQHGRRRRRPARHERVRRRHRRLGAGAPRPRRPPTADARTNAPILVLEPLRWALALLPDWIALEQVPPVLPLWEATARALRRHGYHTWTAASESSVRRPADPRPGGPARATRAGVRPPQATHQRYVKGEPARHRPRSMASCTVGEHRRGTRLGHDRAALGDHPAKKRETGGRRGLGAGSGAERAIAAERARGAWLTDTGNTRGGTTGPRAAARRDRGRLPAITSRADQLKCGATSRPDLKLVENGNPDNAAQRTLDEPAPTIAFGSDGRRMQWVFERPATTVNGDPRIAAPRPPRPDEPGSGRPATVRVTVEEAAALSDLPARLPVAGRPRRPVHAGRQRRPPLAAAHICGP